MNQGEAAESVVRMSLNGVETAVKISGTSIKGALALIYAYNQNNSQLKGKTKLNNMLRTGKELKVFSLKEKNLEDFAKKAKRYGVLYSALIDKKGTNLDGMVDIMVKAEDAPKINRIVERFDLISFDDVSIKAELEKTKSLTKKEGISKNIDEVTLVDEILSRKENKEVAEKKVPELISQKNSQLKSSLKTKNHLEAVSNRASVKKEINDIKHEQQKGIKRNEKSSKTKKDVLHKKTVRKTKKKQIERV